MGININLEKLAESIELTIDVINREESNMSLLLLSLKPVMPHIDRLYKVWVDHKEKKKFYQGIYQIFEGYFGKVSNLHELESLFLAPYLIIEVTGCLYKSIMKKEDVIRETYGIYRTQYGNVDITIKGKIEPYICDLYHYIDEVLHNKLSLDNQYMLGTIERTIEEHSYKNVALEKYKNVALEKGIAKDKKGIMDNIDLSLYYKRIFDFSKAESENFSNSLNDDYSTLLKADIRYKERNMSIEDFIDSFIKSYETSLLLTGEGGCGKTETMRYIWRTCIRQYEVNLCLPIMIDIKVFSKNRSGILDYINTILDIEGLRFSSWLQLSKFMDMKSTNIKILLLADGFNEVREGEKRNIIDELDEIKRLGESNIKLIISSRYIPAALSNFDEEIYILPISKEMKKKYLLEQGIEEKELKNALQIVITPFLISLYSKNYRLEDRQLVIMKRLGAKSQLQNSSDVLWNYSKSLYAKIAVYYDSEALQDKFIILFHILPFVAHNLEKEQKMLFSPQWFRNKLKEFCNEDTNCDLDDVRYCDAFACNFINGEWNCKEIIKNSSKVLNFLCNEITILKRNGTQYSFSHHIIRDFYAALHEFNLANYIMNSNCFIRGNLRPVLHNSVRKYYHNLFDRELLFEKYKSYKEELSQWSNSFVMLCEIISDEYYFLDNNLFHEFEGDSEKDIKIHHRDNALRYTEEAAQLNGVWASWNAAFLYKQKINSNNSMEENNKFFGLAYMYTKRAIEQDYYAGYDVMAQFLIDDRYHKLLSYHEHVENELRYEEAVKYLEVAKKSSYAFAFNKHGQLYEDGRLTSENPIQSAFDLYLDSAKRGNHWAKSRVSQYIRLFWNKLDQYKSLSKEEALIKSLDYLNEIYNELNDNSAFISIEDMRYIAGYESILINVGNSKRKPSSFDFEPSCLRFYRKAYNTSKDKEQRDMMIYAAMMLLISSKILGEKVEDSIKNVDEAIIMIIKKYIMVDTHKKNFFINKCLQEQKEYFEKFMELYKREAFEVCVQEYALELLQNHNDKASIFTKDLVNIHAYKELLYKLQNFFINAEYRDNRGVIYDELFRMYQVEHTIRELVDINKITPCISVAYGTLNYTEYVLCGNSQEYVVHEESIIEEIEKVSMNTVFDLASITKVFTSVAILILVERDLINLNDFVGNYDTRFYHIKNLTIMDIIAFKVTLKTEKRLEHAVDKEELEQLIFSIREEAYNTKNPYSDINAIVLSYIIEKVTGKSFFDFIMDNIIEKSEMQNTSDSIFGKPLEEIASNNHEVSYKDEGMVFETRVKKGIVHDPKARRFQELGIGMKGHAGLFSTVEDMCKFCKALLKGKIISRYLLEKIGMNQTGRMLSDETYSKFLGYQCYSKHPEESNSEVSHILSGCTIGMAGYTGMHMTIDMKNNIFSFIASNRCHFRLTNMKEGLGKDIFYNDRRIYNSRKFVWDRDELVRKINALSLQYSFIEKYHYSNVEKYQIRILGSY